MRTTDLCRLSRQPARPARAGAQARPPWLVWLAVKDCWTDRLGDLTRLLRAARERASRSCPRGQDAQGGKAAWDAGDVSHPRSNFAAGASPHVRASRTPPAESKTARQEQFSPCLQAGNSSRSKIVLDPPAQGRSPRGVPPAMSKTLPEDHHAACALAVILSC
jgi:hypothetical protein